MGGGGGVSVQSDVAPGYDEPQISETEVHGNTNDSPLDKLSPNSQQKMRTDPERRQNWGRQDPFTSPGRHHTSTLTGQLSHWDKAQGMGIGNGHLKGHKMSARSRVCERKRVRTQITTVQ